MAAPVDPVADIVRRGDPDLYLAALYAPADRRAALLAIAAFDIEVARIRDLVSQPLPGEIRLQWWREALAGERQGEAAANPVASALVDAIHTHGLPPETFEACCEARLFDLYDDPMPDRATLEGYLGETVSALIQVAALVLDPAAASRLSDAAGHAGCALGIVRILRRFALHRSRGQCYVPTEILAAAGLDRDGWLAGHDTTRMDAATAAMLALAREHWAIFRTGAHLIPLALRPAFLPAALVPAYLDATPSDAWREPARGISAIRRNWVLLRHAMRGWPALT